MGLGLGLPALEELSLMCLDVPCELRHLLGRQLRRVRLALYVANEGEQKPRPVRLAHARCAHRRRRKPRLRLRLLRLRRLRPCAHVRAHRLPRELLTRLELALLLRGEG